LQNQLRSQEGFQDGKQQFDLISSPSMLNISIYLFVIEESDIYSLMMYFIA